MRGGDRDGTQVGIAPRQEGPERPLLDLQGPGDHDIPHVGTGVLLRQTGKKKEGCDEVSRKKKN